MMRFAVIRFTKSRKWNNCKKQLFVVHFKCQLWNKKALKPTAKQSEGLPRKKKRTAQKCNSIMWTLSRWKLCEPKMARKKTLRGYNGCLKMQSLAITKKGSSWAQWAVRAFVLFVSTEKMGVEVHSKLKKTQTNVEKSEWTRAFAFFCCIFVRWRLLWF